MVMTIPVRAAMGLQKPMSDAELRQWPAKVVSFFLSGCSAGANLKASPRAPHKARPNR
jgi:predicted aminopeptidase